MHKVEDRAGARPAASQLLTLKLAKKKELAKALNVNRNTLSRRQQKMLQEGVAGLVDKTRGPKGAYKLTGEVLAQAQQCLYERKSIQQTGAAVGISEGTIRRAIKQGHLCCSLPAGSGMPVQPEPKLGEGSEGEPALGPGERARRAMQSAAGVGVRRHEERVMTSLGSLEQAMPAFEAMEAVEHGGAFAAIPALLAQGLVETGKAVYGSLRNGFYGLQSVLLTFGLTALLRVRNPEQLQYHPPAELGVLLGPDRIPEVKTLRRKLDEMAQQKKAAEFSRQLAEGWIKQDPDTVGFLYVDGHVRPYHGYKHDLPETHVACRRLCMDATTDFWVNDANAEPVLVVTAPANNSLTSMLREKILPQVHQLVGERRVTVVFDREGWSPRSTGRWSDTCWRNGVCWYKKAFGCVRFVGCVLMDTRLLCSPVVRIWRRWNWHIGCSAGGGRRISSATCGITSLWMLWPTMRRNLRIRSVWFPIHKSGNR